MKGAHDLQVQPPLPIGGPVDELRELQRFVVVEPVVDGLIFFFVKLQVDWVQRVDVQDILSSKPRTDEIDFA